MSKVLLVSGEAGSRLVAADANATQRPSLLNDGVMLGPFASAPPGPTLTRVVVPAARSKTKTSEKLLVSSGTRLLASEWNATLLQSLGTLVKELAPFAGASPSPTLANSVVAIPRSRTKTSVLPLVSLDTRLVASELNATQVQPPSIDGRKRCAWLGPLGFCPFRPTLTRVVWLVS